MKYTIPVSAVLVLVCSVALSAQWPSFQESGVPRDAQGRVQVDAPPPRTPDGKPDLSGNWLRADREPLPSELAGLFSRDRDAGGDVVVEPPVPAFAPDPDSPPVGAFWDIGTPEDLARTSAEFEEREGREGQDGREGQERRERREGLDGVANKARGTREPS